MFEALLTTTSSEGLQPLGSAAQRSFELVTGTIRARLGERHAKLFAEPVATPHGDSIDWYAPFKGNAVPVNDLPAEEQEQLRAELAPLVADIKAEAETLGQSGTADDQRLSEALFNAIEVPDEAMVYAVRDDDGVLHPMLVHWAWVRDEQKAVRGVLTGMTPRRQPATPATGVQLGAAAPVVVPTSPVPSWLWWLLILLGWVLLAVLLGWLLALMIAPCGLSQGRISFCPPPEAPSVTVPGAERRVIEDEIATLQRQLALLDRACQPTEPIIVPSPGDVPDAPGDVPVPDVAPDPPALDPDQPPDSEEAQRAREEAERRAVERGAERGDLNFALEWGTVDDVDLYVTCPTGETISYRMHAACNGTYDLDANVARRLAVEDPVENIVFNNPASGVYQVKVHLRGIRTNGETPFNLHVLRRSGQSQTFSGVLNGNNREWTKSISITE